MGAEARRKELAGDLRRKIGAEAAAAVGELRELLEQTNKNMRAIAAGLAQVEKRIDLAAAAPAAIRRDVLVVADDARRWSAEALEQIEALRLRCRGLVPAEDLAELVDRVGGVYKGLNARLEGLENARAVLIKALTDRHHVWAQELYRLPRLRWRRRRYVMEQMTDTMSLIYSLRATE